MAQPPLDRECEDGGVLDPAVRDDIDRLTKSLEPELVEFRRDLHRHPELGRSEHRTTAVIAERLAAAGLNPRVLRTGTGVICDLSNPAGDPPTLGLRGDLDALPLPDMSTRGYASEVEGRCHACGHDAHATVVLGTGLVLGELATQSLLPRSVRLIFQPAEEVTPGGALDVLAAGEIDGLEEVFALHCDPKIEVGKIGFLPGPITAGADLVRVTLHGRGGHTARPHLTSDLVFALGGLITGLPAVLSRLADPRSGLSVVWGQVHAGAAANAIPQTGFVEGTIRCLDADVWESAHVGIPDLVRSLVAPYGVDVDVDMHTSVPPCVNDPAATRRFQQATAEMLGRQAVTGTDQSLGGEDFAWILGRVDGALARLGVRAPGVADAGDLHQGTFDIDEGALGVGVRALSAIALAQPGAM